MAVATDLRVGVLGRADSRGLAVQSLEVARHLHAAVLAIETPPSPGYVTDPSWFPHGTRVRFDGKFSDERLVRRWLDTVSVVYAAETLYDPRFAEWAARAGTATVVHANPEFVRDRPGWAPPTVTWAPTSWRLGTLPEGAQVVPVPVAHSRWPEPSAHHEGACRWVHVVGKRALADRNGTDAVLAALPLLRKPCSVRVVVQDPTTPVNPPRRIPDHVELSVANGVRDYWDLYAHRDALVYPRRYGGLALPTQEAMGAGLAVVMTDIPPNVETWPVATVPVRRGQQHRMPAGMIEAAAVHGRDLAAVMDRFADPEYRAGWQGRARGWAEAHSWDRWADRYRALLADAVRKLDSTAGGV